MTDDELRAKIENEMVQEIASDDPLSTLAGRCAGIAMRYAKKARASESAFDEAAAEKESP